MTLLCTALATIITTTVDPMPLSMQPRLAAAPTAKSAIKTDDSCRVTITTPAAAPPRTPSEAWPPSNVGLLNGIGAHTPDRMITELDPAMVAEQSRLLAEQFNRQSDAFHTSGHMLDDGMIDPRDTRKALGFMLGTVWEAAHRTLRPNSFGVARL